MISASFLAQLVEAEPESVDSSSFLSWLNIILTIIGLALVYIAASLRVTVDKRQAVRHTEDVVRERRESQLMGLYAPLMVMTQHAAQTKLVLETRARPLLGLSADERFHVLSHAEALMSYAEASALLDDMLEVNRQIRAIVIANSGRVRAEDEITPFVKFLQHQTEFQLAIQRARNRQAVNVDSSYPDALDETIMAGYSQLRSDLGIAPLAGKAPRFTPRTEPRLDRDEAWRVAKSELGRNTRRVRLLGEPIDEVSLSPTHWRFVVLAEELHGRRELRKYSYVVNVELAHSGVSAKISESSWASESR